MQLRVIDDPAPADLEALEDELIAFNYAAAQTYDGRALAILLKNDSGVLYGGLSGHSWGGVCEVSLFWLDEKHRGQGLGARMLAAAEAEARARGCTQITLSTHSFQAPGFYLKMGYREIGRLNGYPRGHDDIWFAKDLA